MQALHQLWTGEKSEQGAQDSYWVMVNDERAVFPSSLICLLQVSEVAVKVQGEWTAKCWTQQQQQEAGQRVLQKLTGQQGSHVQVHWAYQQLQMTEKTAQCV
jgi:hypothetical protein